MKFRYVTLTALLLVLLGINVSAQTDAKPPEVTTTPTPSPQQELEESLARLNAVITERPSPQHHLRADVLFRLGRFQESIADYNTAATLGQPHDDYSCWERGLAQYYAGDYDGGRDQFARYHEVGATDIENGLWRFLCIAEKEGIEKARDAMFAYPDRQRPPFPALLDLYLGHGSGEAVLAMAEQEAPSAEALQTRRFYAHYYLGKYHEIQEKKEKARAEIGIALTYPFRHFMYACAEADAKRLAAPPEKTTAPTD